MSLWEFELLEMLLEPLLTLLLGQETPGSSYSRCTRAKGGVKKITRLVVILLERVVVSRKCDEKARRWKIIQSLVRENWAVASDRENNAA
jgi:hypothetical protein